MHAVKKNLLFIPLLMALVACGGTENSQTDAVGVGGGSAGNTSTGNTSTGNSSTGNSNTGSNSSSAVVSRTGTVPSDTSTQTFSSSPSGTFTGYKPVYSYGIGHDMKGSPGILRYVTNASDTNPLLVTLDRSFHRLLFWRRDVNSGDMYLLTGRMQRLIYNPWSVMSADFNGDGINDIVVQAEFGAFIFTMNADKFVQSSQFVGFYKNYRRYKPSFMIPADYDNDGDIDLVSVSKEAINPSKGNPSGNYSQVMFMTNDGSGNFPDDLKWYLTVSENSNSTKHYVTGRPVLKDIDNDGDIDLLVATFPSASEHTRSPLFVVESDHGWFNQNSAVVVNDSTFSFARDLHPSGAAIVDYNQDGYQDIVVANYLGHNVNIFYGDGSVNGFASAPAEKVTGGNANNGLVVHDMNHDGQLDIVVANADPLNPSVEIFYHGRSESETLTVGVHSSTDVHSSFASTSSPYFDTRYNPGTYPIDLRVFDWDKNGWEDIVTANYSNNSGTETSSFSVVLQSP